MLGRVQDRRQSERDPRLVAAGVAAIENERQYQITREQAAKFEQALQQLATRPAESEPSHPMLRQLEEDALRSQLETLRALLAEYDARAGGPRSLRRILSALGDLAAGHTGRGSGR